MNPNRNRLLKIFALLSLSILACSAPVFVPTAEPLPSPSPTWTLLPPASTTQAPTATEEPLPSETPAPATATLTPTSPTSTEKAFNCPGAPQVRMAVGMEARVTTTDGLPLRVRENPVVSNTNVLFQIPEGTGFTIIDGPECAPIPGSGESYVFWKIQLNGNGPEGWVAEGDSDNYFIEPVP